ncbi:protein YLS7 isoform X1 [Primulina tabacum]|uniref:protein YLS7 isoform X1 n=1 Tax=Primulina tabacum TaxID=48773 RepID=UPI003F59C8A3
MTEVARPAYPRTFLSIVGLVGGLSVFLVLASTVLVQQPIGSTVRGYFYAIDSSIEVRSHSSGGSVSNSNYSDGSPEDTQGSSSSVLGGYGNGGVSLHGNSKPSEKGGGDDSRTVIEKKHPPESLDKKDLSGSVQVESKNSKNVHPYSEVRYEEDSLTTPPSSATAAQKESPVSNNFTQTGLQKSLEPSAATINLKADGVRSGCDLYHGKWVYDPTGPLYTNNSCPIITQMQNCQGNGRPDKEYENWRWKPSKCDLPRFDAKMFLELMRGKTLAFIGDSVARNQMESMLCILWQVEVPKNRGNRKMQRYYFRSTATTIVRIWSSWLVHQTPEPFDFAPHGVVKLHLDLPDEVFMEYISGFDVVVLSSGHWFAKQSVYVLNNEIVGGQLWWPDSSRQKKIDNIEAFGISVETILTAIGTHPNYTGLTLVRTFSPDHYEGGEWNTGGSCTGKERPILEGELVENHFTDVMHEKQVAGFNRAMKKKTNKSKMKLMDITNAFSYRHDGHPGPYRSPDPNKITQRRPDGRPPPQDCLHWCMPGPVDTWNELNTVRKKDITSFIGYR